MNLSRRGLFGFVLGALAAPFLPKRDFPIGIWRGFLFFESDHVNPLAGPVVRVEPAQYVTQAVYDEATARMRDELGRRERAIYLRHLRGEA